MSGAEFIKRLRNNGEQNSKKKRRIKFVFQFSLFQLEKRLKTINKNVSFFLNFLDTKFSKE